MTMQTYIKNKDIFRAKNLFSKHYLENQLKTLSSWKQTDKESQNAFKLIKELFFKLEKELPKINEDQLRLDFINPILKILNYKESFDVEESIPSAFGAYGTPDYSFFESSEKKSEARKHRTDGKYFREVIALGEAKSWNIDLDKRIKHKEKNLKLIPSFQIDFYLKVSGVKWGILTNGQFWRIYCRETSFNKDSFYEINLPYLISTENYDEFKYFFLFFRKDTFVKDAENKCFLDYVYEGSIKFAEELEEDVKDRIYETIRMLAQGFLENKDNKLSEENLNLIHDNILILLYRMLFVLYAESRGFIDVNNEIYKSSFGLDSLKREIAKKLDNYEAISPISTNYWHRVHQLFSLIDVGSEGKKIPKKEFFIPPYNGGLFDAKKHLFLEDYKIGDKILAESIGKLTKTSGGFIDYSTLSIRHLGAIYEGLLEYKLKIAETDIYPVNEKGKEIYYPLKEIKDKIKKILDEKIVKKGELYLVTDKGERKATGSYYTPDYIVKYIVENTLAPIIEEKIKNDGDILKEILSIKVLDPAMGSGHFLVEATTFLANKYLEVLQEKGYEETKEEEEADSVETWAKRLVIERCIYGVDLNPLAVELAKVSLWLHTISHDKSLSFLDHHLKCGNSLIGAKLEDISKTSPLVGGLIIGSIKGTLPKFVRIQLMKSETPEDVHAKESLLADIRKELDKYFAISNVVVSKYFWNDFKNSEFNWLLDYLINDNKEVNGIISKEQFFKKAQEIAKEKRFFHWELEFPEVFFDSDGLKKDAGFDVVIGNPPYVSIYEMKWIQDYLKSEYPEIYSGHNDLSYYFICVGIHLLRRNGKISYIALRYFLESAGALKLREFITDVSNVEEIIDTQNNQIFGIDVNVLTVIFIFSKGQKNASCRAIRIEKKVNEPIDIFNQIDKIKDKAQYQDEMLFKIPIEQDYLKNSVWYITKESETPIIEKIRGGCFDLGTKFKIGQGMICGCKSIFALSQEEAKQLKLEKDVIRNLIITEDIKAYFIDNKGKKLIDTVPFNNIDKFPHTKGYLLSHKKELTSRYDYDGKKYDWFGYQRVQNEDIYENAQPKIITPAYSTSNKFGYDSGSTKENFIGMSDVYAIIPKEKTKIDLKYILTILNSRLGEFYHKRNSKLKRDNYYEYIAKPLSKFPIKDIDIKNDKRYGQLISFADKMIEIYREKHIEIEDFLSWLSTEIKCKIDVLTNRTLIDSYYNYSFEDLIEIFKKNKSKLGIDPSRRDFQEKFRKEFDKSVAKIQPLVEQIQKTDDLIDQIVYKLYGLTDDEIKIVEDSLKKDKPEEESDEENEE